MPTVFISHSSKDSDFIERYIIPALEANGLGYWYSPHSIEPAKQWKPSISRGLESSDWFVVAVSPNSVESEWVSAETDWAFSNRKGKIFPVQIGRCNPDDLELRLRRLQMVDCIRDAKKGADELASLLAKEAAVAGLPRPLAKSYMHPFWKWSMAAIVFVLLAAVAVVVFYSKWFGPTLSRREDQQAQSEPPPSPHERDRRERSGGAGVPAVRNTEEVDTSLPMVRVNAGKFLMGSPSSEQGREPSELQHEVSVNAFWMDPTEVTNAAFQKFLVAKPSWQKSRVKFNLVDDEYLRDWKNTDYPSKRGNYPVTRVSWYAAQEYCTWKKKRLPTEAEWEYAARAGSTKAYWWGDEWVPANAAGKLLRGPDPVDKQAHRNPWKLYDMLGNVREWTNTVYKSYPYNASDGREDPQSVYPRTLRGGSWADDPRYLRSAARTQEPPSFADGYVGFRCASSVKD